MDLELVNKDLECVILSRYLKDVDIDEFGKIVSNALLETER
jgi:hypothetical protein